MKRLFLGIPVSVEVKEKIKPVVKVLQETTNYFNFVSLDNLHLTLKFLGEVDETDIPKIKDKLNQITFSSFLLKFEKIGVFPSLERIKVIWVGVSDSSGLIELMKKINQQLDYIQKNEHTEEVPHLTIARMKAIRNKEKLLETLKKFSTLSFGEMKVEKFYLFESELRPEGPKYKVVGEFDRDSTSRCYVWWGSRKRG